MPCRAFIVVAVAAVPVVVSLRSAMQMSPAFPRNRDPIARALEEVGFPECDEILELGCGPGQHAPDFAARWPRPTFHPTDCDPGSLASSNAHASARGVLGTRIKEASRVDVSEASWPVPRASYDGCFAINVMHIMPRSAVPAFFGGAGAALKKGGVLAIYDTWTFEGNYVGPTNHRFDASLQSQGYGGVPSIEECDSAAQASGLVRRDVKYLPANNQVAVYVRLE